MRYIEAGGARVSVVGLGTWQFGSPEWGYGKAFASGEALRIVQRALDLGINLIDTAEVYGFGASERIVAQALGTRRPEAFLATKVAPAFPFDPVIHRRAVASARRLGVDRIDLYQAHWPNPLFPPEPLFRALGRLQREGLVTHLGVSNYSLAGWQAGEKSLGGPLLSNQVAYSLVNRRPERELLPWAQDRGRLLIAHSPLAAGVLSGRYSGSNRPRAMRSVRPLFLPDNLERAAPLLGALREVAAAHGTTPAQVALAWLLHHPNVVVIPGASSVAQLESNAAAAELELSDEEQRLLDDESSRFSPRAGVGAFASALRTRIPV